LQIRHSATQPLRSLGTLSDFECLRENDKTRLLINGCEVCLTAYSTKKWALISRVDSLKLAESLPSSLVAKTLADLSGRPHLSLLLLPFASVTHFYMD